MIRTWLWGGYAAAWVALGLGLVLPTLLVVGVGLNPALLVETLAHPVHQRGLANSLAIAAVTTVLALGMALPLAWLRARRRHAGQGLAEALVLAPLILPPFVGAIGLQQLLGYHGALNAVLASVGLVPEGSGIDWLGQFRFALLCLLEALHLAPIAYLYLASALRGIDEGLLEAAQAAGAGPVAVLRRVLLPLLRPALFAASSIVFIASFTELGTPLLLGFREATPVQIFEGLSALEQDRTPFALVVVLLAVVAGIYGLSRLLLLRDERRLSAGLAKATGPRVTPRPLGRSGTVAAWLLVAGITGLALAPHAAVVLVAFAGDWYGSVLPPRLGTEHVAAALAHPLVVPAIGNSLRYALLATALAVLAGSFIAYVVARWRPPGARALDVLAMMPLAVPGIVIAFGLLAVVGLCKFSEVQPLAALGNLLDPKRDPTLLLVLAYAVRRLPYAVRAVAAGYSQVPLVYEEAAAVAGAGPWQRLRRIVLPLLSGSLLAGALLTFTFCMLEVADSLILAQKQGTFPITKVIYELVSLLGSGPTLACAFSLWAMAFLGLSMALAGRLFGGRIGEMLAARK